MDQEPKAERETVGRDRPSKRLRWTAPVVLTLALPFAAPLPHHNPIGSPSP